MQAKYFFIFPTIFLATTTITSLQHPEKLTYNDYMQLKKQHCFTGYTLQSKKSFLYLYHSKEGTSITYVYYDKLPETLTKHEKNLFLPHTETISNSSRKIYVMHHGELPAKDSHALKRFFRQKKLFTEKKRNFTIPQNPNIMNTTEISNYLKNHMVLFYTSEGLSNIWNYDKLISKIGINPEEFKQNPEIYCKIIVNNIKKIYSIFKQHCKEALITIPTNAHLALATIVKKTNSFLCTDNIDLLHEKTGLKAHRFWKQKGKSGLSAEFLREIDAVISIGLDKDMYAFLEWYKIQNPQGKIISIDSKQPTYLDNEDFFIKGNIQEILPKIANNF